MEPDHVDLTSGSTGPRYIFFDNLRFLFVCFVVLQHAGMAYSWSDWWPVVDDSSIFVTSLVALFDGFLMPALFYIAGYFAIPSIAKKTISTFVFGKFKRLGALWLVCILFVCPMLPLIYHYTRDGLRLTSSYAVIWLRLMGNAIRFDIGMMLPMNQLMQNDLFYQRYMWFIALLIAFFLIFALVYRLKPGWFESMDQELILKKASIRSTLKTILTIGLLTFSGSTALIVLMFSVTSGGTNPESWFTLGNFVQFRVSRIFLHSTYFILGILTYKRNWIQSGKFPGRLNIWMISFLLTFIAYFSSILLVKTSSGTQAQLFGLVAWFWLNFFTISALGLSMALALKYWNRSTALNRNLASNSYNLYLTHYVFVLGFQLFFIQVQQMPVGFKYLAVSTLALFCGYLVSQFLIKPFPKITVAAVAGIFAAMMMMLRI